MRNARGKNFMHFVLCPKKINTSRHCVYVWMTWEGLFSKNNNNNNNAINWKKVIWCYLVLTFRCLLNFNKEIIYSGHGIDLYRVRIKQIFVVRPRKLIRKSMQYMILVYFFLRKMKCDMISKRCTFQIS